MIILILIGYIAACGFLRSVKWNKIKPSDLKLNSKGRIKYIVLAIVLSAALIALFNIIYVNSTLIHQMKLLFLVSFLLPIAAIDNRKNIIPNVFIISALIIRCVFYLAEFMVSTTSALSVLKDNLIAAVVVGLFFFLISLVFKNSIGMGDVKLFAVMGLYQGLWGAINSVFFSLVVSFVLSIILLISHRKKRKDTISFAPSILLGTVIAIGLSGI